MQALTFLWLLFTYLAHCGFGVDGAKFNSLESMLTDKLLKGYNAQMRPQNPEYDNRTLVKLGMTLSQIISVKEKSQELTTSVYMTHEWKDERFHWTPSNYDGITICRVPPSAVWTPRIILQNSKDDSFDVSLMTNVLIHHNGNMEWLPPALYRSTCTIEVALFPFDWQNCTMVFRSATYDRSQMEMGLAYGDEIYVDPEAFQPNGEWDLIQKPVRVNTADDDEFYQDVTFYFIIRRRPQFYVMNLILPCILMSSLSCFVFYLPSISCEKMTLSISILLGETVFLFLIAQRMPETSLAVPLIAGYLLFCMTLVILSVITSVIVCNVHYRSNTTHVMSDWVVTVFMNWIGPFLKVERPGAEDENSGEEPAGVVLRRRASSVTARKAMRDRTTWKAPSEILFDHQAERYGFRPRHTRNAYGFSEVNLSNNKSDDDTLLLPPAVQTVPDSLKSAVEAINYIAQHKKDEDQNSSSQDDWAYVARVLDYTLLWLYCATFCLGTLAFFLQTTFADYPQPLTG